MTILAAGASASISLPAGQFIQVTGGAGVAQVLNMPGASPIALDGNVKIGPFDVLRTVSLSATVAVDYKLSDSTLVSVPQNEADVLAELAELPIPYPGLQSILQTFTSKAALFVGTALNATATVTAYRVRIASTDLAPVSAWNTNTTGYAVGSKSITTAAGGVGALYRNDTISVAGSGETYTSLSADSDLSNVGTVTLAGYGLAAAIPAATTLLSVLARGERIYGAINCDNATEAAIACADPNQRDFELKLGEAIIVSSTAPISNVWFTTSGGIAINAHRLDVQFGA